MGLKNLLARLFVVVTFVGTLPTIITKAFFDFMIDCGLLLPIAIFNSCGLWIILVIIFMTIFAISIDDEGMI